MKDAELNALMNLDQALDVTVMIIDKAHPLMEEIMSLSLKVKDECKKTMMDVLKQHDFPI